MKELFVSDSGRFHFSNDYHNVLVPLLGSENWVRSMPEGKGGKALALGMMFRRREQV